MELREANEHESWPFGPHTSARISWKQGYFLHGHSAGASVSKFNTDVIIFVLESSLGSGIFSYGISSVSFNMEYVLSPALSSVTLTIFGKYRLHALFLIEYATLCV